MNHNKNIIDLHGVRHHNVEEVLENTLLGFYSTEGWEIITGNSPYMIQIVEGWLNQQTILWYREPHNYGKIILAE